MSITVSNGVGERCHAPTARTGDTVAVLVRGQQVTVECPAWCTAPHTEAYRSLEDVSHHSGAISLAAPSYGGALAQALITRVSAWPFAGDPETERPFIALDAASDADTAQLTVEQVNAFADQVIAHGHALRALAATIAGGAR